MAKETFTRDKPHLTPVNPPSGDLTGITIITTAGVLTQFDVDFTVPDISGYYWKFEASIGQPLGKMSVKESSLIRIATMENVGLIGTASLITEYQTRFGDPALGVKVFVRATMVDSVSGHDWLFGIFSGRVSGT